MTTASEASEIELYVIKKVKDYREIRGISQSELATKLGLSNGFVGQVESTRHRAKYNLNHINKLAEIFQCSPKDFMPEKFF